MNPVVRAVHGGASFEAIGVDFSRLGSHEDVVDADVLDAWYEPAPGVLEQLRTHLDWLVKTSPPTHGDGLREAIAAARGVARESVLIGCGTSSLMFLALPTLLKAGEQATILDPMYGEYRHLAETVIGGRVVTCDLREEDGFRVAADALVAAAEGSRLVMVVNPNSPTGVVADRSVFQFLLDHMAPDATLWVDETYIDFAPGVPSVEGWVARDPRIVVSKSMSKYYGLSGLRVGYLVAAPERVAAWEMQSPPWSVGLIGQVAGVEALRDAAYYRERVAQTHQLREAFAEGLGALPGVRVFDSVTNYLLFSTDALPAADLCAALRERKVFLRDCDSLSTRFEGRFVRTAVKDAETNGRILAALDEVFAGV